jgi:KDO2-lipid IV(A) lauroyltransferase
MKNKHLVKTRFTILFWIVWNVSRLLPLPLTAKLLSRIMRFFAHVLTRQDIIYENLAKAFPEMSAKQVEHTAKQVAANLGIVGAELCHIEEFVGGVANGRLTFEDHGQIALASVGPAIFVGTHQWNWEIAPIVFVENGLRTVTIYSKFRNEVIDHLIMKARQKTGARYLEKRKAMRQIIDELASGGSLCVVMDQRVRSGVPVKLFGRDTLMTGFPARLAIRFQCPIVPIYMERREGHKFHLVFGKPIFARSRPGENTVEALTQAIAAQFEDSIRRSPGTWLCNRRRWLD